MLLAWRLRTQQELAIRRRRGAGIAAAQPGKHAETTRTTPSSVANSDLYEQHWYMYTTVHKKKYDNQIYHKRERVISSFPSPHACRLITP